MKLSYSHARRRRSSGQGTVCRVVCIFALLCAGLTAAFGTTVIAFDTEALIARSAVIVQGTCIDSESFRDQNGLIVTRYRFRVEESFRGDENNTLEFVQPGGEYRGIRTIIPGLSAHQIGDEAFLFLTAPYGEENECRLPVGLDQGVFRIQQQADGSRQVTRNLAALTRVPNNVGENNETSTDDEDGDLEELPDSGSLADFRRVLRTRVASSSGNSESTNDSPSAGEQGLEPEELEPEDGEQ